MIIASLGFRSSTRKRKKFAQKKKKKAAAAAARGSVFLKFTYACTILHFVQNISLVCTCYGAIACSISCWIEWICILPFTVVQPLNLFQREESIGGGPASMIQLYQSRKRMENVRTNKKSKRKVLLLLLRWIAWDSSLLPSSTFFVASTAWKGMDTLESYAMIDIKQKRKLCRS